MWKKYNTEDLILRLCIAGSMSKTSISYQSTCGAWAMGKEAVAVGG
jgi:hypothetical protein